MIYVGTWDGYFSAFDAGTGDLRWRHDATGGISGAPTVMAGLVYYSTFGKFTNSHQRRVEEGLIERTRSMRGPARRCGSSPTGSTRRWSPTRIASISPGARPCTAWSRARPVDG